MELICDRLYAGFCALWSSGVLLDPKSRSSISSSVCCYYENHRGLSLFFVYRERLGQLTTRRLVGSHQLGLFSTLHACLASKARLNISRSWKPSPPMYFGLVMISHDTHAGFILPCLLPYQNCLMMDVIFLHKPLGSRKHAME